MREGGARTSPRPSAPHRRYRFRAIGFFATVFRVTGFLAIAFLAGGFFAAAGFRAAGFLAAGFFAAADFLDAGFFAAGFLAAGIAAGLAAAATVESTVRAPAAIFCTAAIPLIAARFVSYAALAVTILPLLESSEKRNFPVGPFLTMNVPGIERLPC